MPIAISRFQILTACNCIVYLEHSGIVEDDHFNHTSHHLAHENEKMESFFDIIKSFAQSLC